MKYGIDISHWQGAIDFSKVTAEFVIMKLSQYQTKDSKFEKYYSECQAPKGCYIYNKVTTLAKAKAEAEYAVKCLAGRPMPMGVWLDLEDATMRILGKAMLSNIIETEASILRAAGYAVGIYCNRDWYMNVLDSASLSKAYPFWVARYPASDNGTVKTSLSPQGLNNCVMWQYSSKGKVPGINGNVDMDLLFDDLPETIPEVIEKYVAGNTYTLDSDLYVRENANSNKIKYDALTQDGKKHAIFDDYGCAIMKKGTKVTCKEVKKLATSTWIRIPSGWICAKNSKSTYII